MRFLSILLAVLIIVADQWSKSLILANPELSQIKSIEITSFFNLALVYNRGVSFGMFAGQNQPLLLVGLSVAIMLILLVWLWRNRVLPVALAIGGVLGGAMGNVIDRVRYGAVVDFLDFHINELHYPSFNIADACIFIGVAILVIHSIFFDKKQAVKQV